MNRDRPSSSDEDPKESSKAEGSLVSRGGKKIDDLIHRIRESTDRLAEDGSSRGDLKIVSRAIRELRYAFKVFSQYRHHRKVTVFGSARTPAEDPSYQQAVAYGKAMADHDWLVVTGAASGIMEAGHVGAGRKHSMGLNIILPFEQESNPIIAGDHKLVHMKYFFTRKLMFVKECDAVVCLPGGFGTMDEALEVLTLLQTGKREMVPVVLLDAPGEDYWKALDQFVRTQLLERGMISKQDLSLYKLTDSCEEAVQEVLGFFHVYHSMRYVKDQLVLRLRSSVSAKCMSHINENFTDILEAGGFELLEALPDEQNEPDLADMPRLAFHFNRRHHGRLRQLIDVLNADRGVD